MMSAPPGWWLALPDQLAAGNGVGQDRDAGMARCGDDAPFSDEGGRVSGVFQGL
jgi:hypothetical protein